MPDLEELFERLPPGWSLMTYAGHRWGVTRSVQAGGRTENVYAERLGGLGVVSANLYRLVEGAVLKPCEMPAERVLAFLRDAQPLDDQPLDTQAAEEAAAEEEPPAEVSAPA